jgi:hypothetical protein
MCSLAQRSRGSRQGSPAATTPLSFSYRSRYTVMWLNAQTVADTIGLNIGTLLTSFIASKIQGTSKNPWTTSVSH